MHISAKRKLFCKKKIAALRKLDKGKTLQKKHKKLIIVIGMGKTSKRFEGKSSKYKWYCSQYTHNTHNYPSPPKLEIINDRG